MRLIDANAFIFEYCMNCGCGCDVNEECCATVCDLRNAPTVDAVEVVHGRWEEATEQDEELGEIDSFKCSVCGKLSWFETNYCPNCGARMMDGDGNG